MIDYTLDSKNICSRPNVDYIHIDDITYVRYKNATSTRLCHMSVITNMLIIILEGSKHVCSKPGNEMVINKNEAFFMPKGSYLATEVISELNQFRSLVFFIGNGFLEKFVNKHVETSDIDSLYEPDIFRIDLSSLYFESLQKIVPFFIKEKEFRCELFKLKIEEVLILLNSTEEGRNYFTHIKNQFNNNLVELAEMMKLNYKKPYTIEQFAQKSGRSISSFKRDFQKIYSLPPNKWLSIKRLEFARLLLESTNFCISEVCYKSGFGNISYFIQSFKKSYGITPKQFKLDYIQHKLN